MKSLPKCVLAVVLLPAVCAWPAQQKPAEQKPAEQKPTGQQAPFQLPGPEKAAEQKQRKPAERKPAEPGKIKPITQESRIWLMRGMTAEYATLRRPLPRGEKGLPLDASGKIDERELLQRITDNGPAAHPGELVQITAIQFKKDQIVLEINGGGKKKRKWYEGIQVGTGTNTHPVATNQSNQPATGSYIEMSFDERVPDMTVDDLKQRLSPVFDFTRRSPTQLYTESLPPEIQEAIKNHEAKEGMDREMVLASMGRPENKIRESKRGVDTEDWVYGKVPAKVTIVTFEGDKVVKIKELRPGIADPGVKTVDSAEAGTIPTPPAPPPNPVNTVPPGQPTSESPVRPNPPPPSKPPQ